MKTQVAVIIATLFLSQCIEHNALAIVDGRNDTLAKRNEFKESIISTFSVAGIIFTNSSYNIRVVPPDILYGQWRLHVKEGNLTEFLANFSMVRLSGLERHIVYINNFHKYPDAGAMVRLDINGSTSHIMGLADVKIDNLTNLQVNTAILINRLSTIVIILPYLYNTSVGGDTFRAKPITGLVNSFQ